MLLIHQEVEVVVDLDENMLFSDGVGIGGQKSDVKKQERGCKNGIEIF